MTKQQAHQVLALWKCGAVHYQIWIINHALVITGDLDE